MTRLSPDSWLCYGERALLRSALSEVPCTLSLKSTAFLHGGRIPQRHADKPMGDNLSPELHWSGVPDDCAELVLVMQSPDAFFFSGGLRLVATAIDPRQERLTEGALNAPNQGALLHPVTFYRVGYVGPGAILAAYRCVFHLLALRRTLYGGELTPLYGPRKRTGAGEYIVSLLQHAARKGEVAAWGQLEATCGN